MRGDNTRIRNPVVTDTALFEGDTRNKLLVSTCAVFLENSSLLWKFYALSATGMVTRVAH